MTHQITADDISKAIDTFLPNDFRVTDDMMAWDMSSMEDIAFAIASHEEALASANNALEHTWAAYQEGNPADPKEIAHNKAKRTRVSQRLGLLTKMQKHLIANADIARQNDGGIKAMRKLANALLTQTADRFFRNTAREEIDRDTFMMLARKADDLAHKEIGGMGLTPVAAADFLEAYAARLRANANEIGL